MSSPSSVAVEGGLGATQRIDRWWVGPLSVGIVFALFIAYSTWAAFQGDHYLYTGNGAHYLSPFYSPDLFALFSCRRDQILDSARARDDLGFVPTPYADWLARTVKLRT